MYEQKKLCSDGVLRASYNGTHFTVAYDAADLHHEHLKVSPNLLQCIRRYGSGRIMSDVVPPRIAQEFAWVQEQLQAHAPHLAESLEERIRWGLVRGGQTLNTAR